MKEASFYPEQLLFMDDAIQGGYQAVLSSGEVCNFKPSTLTGGGCHAVVRSPYGAILNDHHHVSFEVFIQDPRAWEAVGKTRNWRAYSDTEYVKRGHFFWELRCKRKTAEEALKIIDKYHHE